MKKILLLISISAIFLLSACQSKQPEELLLPDPVSIAVAPFNQPTLDEQLLAGYIPKFQGVADPGVLQKLDAKYARILQQKSRRYIFLEPSALNIAVQRDSQGRKNVLSTWAALARAAGADYIIVPQVLNWDERIGDVGDVSVPAKVIMDFYLIDARQTPENQDGLLQTRSHYMEAPILPAPFAFGGASPRVNQPASDFAEEAMYKSMHDFSL